MCSLCGDLSLPHWSDHAGGDAEPAERRRHRGARMRYASALLAAHGLTLSEWQGRYLLGNGRGRTVVVADLGACWAAAEQLAGRPIDPLAAAATDALAGARA